MVEILTESKFKQKVKKGMLVVEFFADWCKPCKEMKPVLEKLEKTFPKVKFGRIDVDQRKELCSSLVIVSIPTFMIFKDGIEIERLVDKVPIEVLQNEIEMRLK